MPDEDDHGTLAPTAPVASIPFAPEICIPEAWALRLGPLSNRLFPNSIT
jgi:hypothetical protein